MSGSAQSGKSAPQGPQPQLLSFIDQTTKEAVGAQPITPDNLAAYLQQAAQTAGMVQTPQIGSWVIVPATTQVQQGQALLAQPGVQIVPQPQFAQRYQPADDAAAQALQQAQQFAQQQQGQAGQAGQQSPSGQAQQGQGRAGR